MDLLSSYVPSYVSSYVSSYVPSYVNSYIYGTDEVPSGPKDPDYDAAIEQLYHPCLQWGAYMVGSYLLTTIILYFTTSLRGLSLQRIAGYASQYPFFVLMVYYAHVGTSDLIDTTPENRTFSSNESGDTFATIYIASNIVAAMGQLQTEKGALLVQLMIHHVLSILCFGAGFAFERYRFWIYFAGCCELTNLFLVPVFAAKELPYLKSQSWYKYNCTLLWSTFVTHRFLLFPYWLYLWFSDRATTDVKDVHFMEEYAYPGTIAGLMILSII
eukprot:CAMPEP_0118655348 /NCGR_PEP_ID=MMETSP0785-20121206/12876_1 /TAXON_ID=91992 /ORGANISM="Bolidomonas pacifica, Strain CCMP 1866" /LENGTH=270 /DNA_ID=CAMNT_0006548071 /DNA_START=106 /DNA_END=915 /DNA_ORIENTATION=-